MKNAKKNLVFHFGGGHHAPFPHKPVVKGSLTSEGIHGFIFLMSRTGFLMIMNFGIPEKCLWDEIDLMGFEFHQGNFSRELRIITNGQLKLKLTELN